MLKRSASRGVSHLRLRFFFVGKFRLIDFGISGEERGGKGDGRCLKRRWIDRLRCSLTESLSGRDEVEDGVDG